MRVKLAKETRQLPVGKKVQWPGVLVCGEVWDRAPLEGPGPDHARCTALRGAITSLSLMSKRLLLVTKYSA